jgi:hypothetical protein
MIFSGWKERALARREQRMFASPENHGLENASSVCHPGAGAAGPIKTKWGLAFRD